MTYSELYSYELYFIHRLLCPYKLYDTTFFAKLIANLMANVMWHDFSFQTVQNMIGVFVMNAMMLECAMVKQLITVI